MTDNPITMQEISNRDRIIGKKVNNFYVTETSKIDDKPLNTGLINTITRPVNNISAEQFMVNSTLNKASINANCMCCFTILMELMEENTRKNGLYYSTIQKLKTYFINNVLRNLTSSKIDLMKARVNNDVTLDNYPDFKKAILDTIEDVKVCDRIVKNKDKISNRFDVNKVVLNNPQEPVEELCSLLDTYNIPIEAKYNISIENIPYALYRNGVQMPMGEILEHVNNYYLNRNLVITDPEIKKLSRVLEKSQMITQSDIELSGSDKIIRSAFNPRNWSQVVKLAQSCNDKESTKIIMSLNKIDTEKKASEYIHVTMFNKFIDKATTYNDRINLYTSAFYISLVVDISKEFIKNEMLKFNDQVMEYKDFKKRDFDDFLDLFNLFKNGNNLNEESAKLYESVDNSDNIYSESYIDNRDLDTVLRESEEDDIKDIINGFKAEQDKNPSKFKALINKIYGKPAESIINGTPSILSATRYGFIFSSAAFPVIGPVIAAVSGLVDYVISLKVSMSQAKKLYKYLKDEKTKISKKLDTADDEETLKKLKSYDKSLDKCISKVSDYITNIDEDDEDVNSADDDDFDFNFESAGLESVIEYLQNNGVTSISEDINITEAFDPNTIKLALKNFQSKLKELNAKQKQMWINIDNNAKRMTDGIQKALTNDRRENIIRGSIIPSFSKCIKSALIIGGAYFVNPVLAIITAFGMFATSKVLNERERSLLYDEIDIELQVVEKKINLAENDGDMDQYRFLLTYQRKLQREKQRIKYGIKAPVRNIPGSKNRD